MSQTKAQLLNPSGDIDFSGQLTGVGATFSANIKAVDGEFTGNVSVAGTLTKQDVTNVDSVGLITARSGINVTGGNVFIGQGGSGANNAELKLQAGAGTGNDIIAFLNQAGATKGNITYDTDNNFLLFNTDGAERARIGSSGLAQFKVDAASSAATQVRLENNAAAGNGANPDVAVLGYASGGSQKASIRAAVYGEGWMSFHNNNDSEKMRLTASGALGIGTDVISGKLDVNGAIYAQDRASSSGAQLSADGALEIWRSNSDAYIDFKTGVGEDFDCRIQQASNGINFVTGGNGSASERLRIGSSGEIGIAGANYGNAGQVITSGGSGSTITWADAAGGAEYAGISSGAISTGNPVVVRNDGKLEKVKYSWAESITTGALAEGSSTIASAGAYGSWARNDDGTTWSGDNSKRVLFIFRYGNTPGYRTADYSGNTLTLNSLGGWNDGDGIAQWDAAYNSNGKRFAAVYRHNSNGRARFVVGRPSGTTVTWGTGTNGSSGRLELSTNSTSNAFGVEYAGNDKFMAVYGEGSKIYAQVVTNSSSNNYMTLSAGTRVEIEDTGTAYTYRIHVTKPDSNGRMLVFYMKPIGGDAGLKMAVLTISGTDVSYGGRDWVSSTNKVHFQPAAKTSYDPNEDRYLLIYERISDSRMYGRNMKITDATTISMSAETQLYNQDPYEGGDTVYDTNLKKHFVYLLDNSTNKLSYVPTTFTGSAAPTAGTLGIIYNTAQKFRNFITDYDPTLGKILFASRNASASGSGDYLGGLITTTASSTSNLTDTNFIGLSKGNYTDGNTAKVLTSGGIDENQSSLTIGQKYFVQPDGTLGTSKASSIAYAGQAVSSTDLLVASNTIPQSTEGILGYWEWGLCENAFKPWCAGNRFMGAYDNDGGSSSCNFCFGKWYPQACRYGDHHQGFDFTENIPDSSGGNMCLCTGGYCCNGIGTCCCSWNASCPDGRFGFPSIGLYCYNLEMQWGFCSAMAQGGCMALTMLFAGKKCRNTACDTYYCDVNGYTFNMNHCNFCQKNFEYHNVRLSGKVPVADTDINIMSFRMWESGIGAQVRGDGICNLNQCSNVGCYGSRVSFTKISNNPGYTYC